MRAVLKGWLYVPYGAVGDLTSLKEELTYRPGRSMDGERRDPVELFRDVPTRGIIGVPQAFGARRFGRVLEIVDRTTQGEPMGEVPRLPSPDHPSVQSPERQAKFMADMMAAVREYRTFIAYAPTGSGKTVVGLRTAAEVGRKTLVVVHLARLRDQWVQEAVDKLGLPPHRVGIVEGARADWRDKDVVVAMLQSLAYEPLRYGKEFHESFGTVIFDEVHRIGAPVFGRAVWQFPAAVRFGLSATPSRKDQGGKVFFWHLGPLAVRSEQEALPIQVCPVWYDCGSYKVWGQNHGARVKCLSLDPHRNERIVGLIQKMYNGGRQTLVVSESIDHLQRLMRGAERVGVPGNIMGQFTNMVHYKEQVDTDNGKQWVLKKRRQSAGALNRIKRESQIIFATYGMIKEGIDIPRLDGGIDATPRSDATQLIGRLRRPHPGKKFPVLWLTIVDSNCDRSLRYFEGRLNEYRQCGAEVMNGVG